MTVVGHRDVWSTKWEWHFPIDDIRIPRWPWDEWALSHECEANAGKVAAKIQESYGKLWQVWQKRK